MTLLPFPISILYYNLLSWIPCNLASPFCSAFLLIVGITVEVLLWFSLLLLIFVLTQNMKLISLRKTFLISVAIQIVSLISVILVYFPWYKDPMTLIKLGLPVVTVNIFDIVIQILLPSVIISLSLYLMLKRLHLQKVAIISLTVFLAVTQWQSIPAVWASSERQIQRALITDPTRPESVTKFFVGIKHEIINEEIINDSHNPKYKSFRINVKLTVPESYSYLMYTELYEKSGKTQALQAYIHGKSYFTQPIDIQLNKGENLVTFDFPYVWFNDYQKKEQVSLPYNDSPTGTYGPFRFTFGLVSTYLRDNQYTIPVLDTNDLLKLEYKPPIYTTKNIYNYSDFYQR